MNKRNSLLTSIDKNAETKKKILRLCMNQDFSIAELSNELNISIPTITKIMSELMEKGLMKDKGKQDTPGGRRPSFYGLNSSVGYIIGVEVNRNSINICLTNFKGHIINSSLNIPFTLVNTEESFNALTDIIKNRIKKYEVDLNEILTCGVTLSGRVNSSTGYSFTYFLSEDKPLAEVLEAKLGMPVFIENDSRAMAYGEYILGVESGEKNILFFNVSWGLGMGMILDSKLYYGKSGFSGEMGHFPLLNNDIICRCGKVGCLETGASGSAAHRIIMEKLAEGRNSILSDKYKKGEEITTEDIIMAVREEDFLAIEIVEKIGSTLGRAIAGLINLFNPELVIIGGRYADVGDYIMLPIKNAINKFSLSIVSRDTSIRLSKLREKAGPVGVCLLARDRMLELI